MKYWSFLVVFFMIYCSCEDVVEVDAPSEPPRLAIDALVRINASAPTTTVQIKASLTDSFFEGTSPAELTTISIINPDYVPVSPLDQKSLFLEEVSPGLYEGTKRTLFFTEGALQLFIEHNGQRYLAQTSYVPTVPIDNLEQGDDTLFSEDEKEVIISFTDEDERDDFYLFDFDFDEYLVTEDEFYQGQTFQFSYFYFDGLNENQVVEISILGVDEPFFNYMNQLIVQAGGDQGPFQTPAATVRGNIVNITDIDNIDSFDNVENTNNFALGYFAVSQEFKETIVIE